MRTMTARMPSLPCSMYRRKKPSWITGAHFDGDQSGTVNGVTPPAVQHLTAEVTADSGEYQVLARWDTPKVVKGVSFMLRLTVAADDGSERLVSTARTTETTYRFTQLALGNYRLTVRAANALGTAGRSGVGIVPDCRTGSTVED